METRIFGRTGHSSSVAIFGAFAFSSCSQSEADAGMEQLIAAGVNHIDVAPTYGHAEERLGPWLATERERFFLGCKTTKRTREEAAAELRRSLERLQVSAFDLYQIHGVTTFQDLDDATRPGAALDAIVQARQEGLTRFIGLTGHGYQAPEIFLEALRRFDFDSLLFAINPTMFADPNYREQTGLLLQQCRERNVGTMIIKVAAQEPWGGSPRTHNTWYRPFTDQDHIQQNVNFVLSQPVTGLCTPGDLELLPRVLEACQNYTPLSPEAQETLIAQAQQYESIFDV